MTQTTQSQTTHDFGIQLSDLPHHVQTSHTADLFDDAKTSLLADLKEAAVDAHSRRRYSQYADLMFLHDRIEDATDSIRVVSPAGTVAYISRRDCQDPQHDHFEDGAPMACRHCHRPTFYDYNVDQYRHVDGSGCFLHEASAAHD